MSNIAEKIEALKGFLKECKLCPLECGVDRLNGEIGFCNAGKDLRVFFHSMLYGEEREISPTYGIYLAGCDLRCQFCSTKEYVEKPYEGKISKEKIAENIKNYKPKTISFIGGEPSVSLYGILKFIKDSNFHIPLVLNSNMYFSPELWDILDGVFDYYIADIHFGNDRCAQEIGGCSKNYFSTVTQNILKSTERSNVIIRHLLIPSHLECCFKPIVHWIRDYLPGVKFHLMTNFYPFNNQFPYSINEREILEAKSYAEKMGLNLYTDDSFLQDVPQVSEEESIEVVIDRDGTVVFPFSTALSIALLKNLRRNS